MDNDKYRVFKYGDVTHDTDRGEMRADEDTVVTDAVVIRTQDVFAESGLRQYANAIRAHLAASDYTRAHVLELIAFRPRHMAKELFEILDANTVQARALEEIAVYFDACADEAEDRRNRQEAKIPD